MIDSCLNECVDLVSHDPVMVTLLFGIFVVCGVIGCLLTIYNGRFGAGCNL